MSRTYRNKDGYKPLFSETWGNNSGTGKYWKRQLNKARRRFAKMTINFGKGKSPSHYESEVNWRGW